MDQRAAVAWTSLTGRQPPKELSDQFSRRGLVLSAAKLSFTRVDTALDVKQIFWPDYIPILGSSRAIILDVGADKYRRLNAVANLLNEPRVKYSGAPVGLFLDEPGLAGMATKVLNASNLTARWNWVGSRERFAEIAQAVLDNNPGPSPRFDLPIDEGGQPLNDELRTLLRRAFADCESLVVRILGEQGLSGSIVFKAFAEHRSPVGTRTKAPFLVKITKRADVDREMWGFENYVKDYIPFHARPNIEAQRSSRDSELGILVGNYVEGAFALLDALQRGWDPAHLSSLLEDCLGKWVHSATTRSGHPVVDNATRFSAEKFSANARVRSEIQKLRLSPKPEMVLARLKKIPCSRYLAGVVHKDLNARNILLRRNEAILIDFEKCEPGPALLDLATLDVSISFDCFLSLPKEEQLRNWQQWVAYLDELYLAKNLTSLPQHKQSYLPFSPQWQAIRQIRRWAYQERVASKEYRLLVALELLRKSQFDQAKIESGGAVGAQAYKLADRLAR